MAKYHTLLTKDGDNMWRPYFGDYSMAVVKQERLDVMYSYELVAAQCKIITTGDKQSDIDAEVRRLNNAG